MANLNENRFRLTIAARHDAMLETLKVLARNMAEPTTEEDLAAIFEGLL